MSKSQSNDQRLADLAFSVVQHELDWINHMRIWGEVRRTLSNVKELPNSSELWRIMMADTRMVHMHDVASGMTHFKVAHVTKPIK